MINVVCLNILGFFYLTFFIPLLARIYMNTSRFKIGLMVSTLEIGFLLNSTFIGTIFGDHGSYKEECRNNFRTNNLV